MSTFKIYDQLESASKHTELRKRLLKLIDTYVLGMVEVNSSRIAKDLEFDCMEIPGWSRLVGGEGRQVLGVVLRNHLLSKGWRQFPGEGGRGKTYRRNR